MEPCDFGWALRALKCGKRVAREGWNGKGQWLWLIRSEDLNDRMFGLTKMGTAYPMRDCIGVEETYAVQDCIAIRTTQGTLQPGWLASQSDMLAEDWMIVE